MATIYNVELKFDKDFVEYIISELGKHNINVDNVNDHEKIKIKYFNFTKRLVPSIPRQVLKSNVFTCPPELQSGLQLLENKITSGDNLFPNLSKQIINLDYNDSLLNDWGIHHLHLGASIESDGFIQRTGPVLFARFDNTKAYFINVMPHGSWTNQQIIKVLHNNWASSIEGYRIKDVVGLDHIPTDDDVKKGRKFGVNILLEIEPGVVYAPIGGGYTTGKTGIDVMMRKIETNRLINQLEKHVKENSEKYGQQLKEQFGYMGTQLDFKLLIQNGEYFAVEQNTNASFNLGRY